MARAIRVRSKERPKKARCECGNMYYGDNHYYKTEYCSCGRRLYWDKHSSLAIQDTQYQSSIRSRDYDSDEWSGY